MNSPPTALVAALAVALVLAWFGTLGERKLVKTDEGRYAEISREMAASGDWITPRYNGVKYFEKPPLLYWASAAAFKVFGETEWAARLWVALTGFAGILISFFTARAVFDARAALAGAAVLASSPLWIAAGHLNTTDMGVAFFLHAALCAFVLAQRPGATDRERRTFMLLCWAAMAVAVLSKGLIGVVLPGLALGVYVLVTRDFSLLRRLHIGKGACVFLAIAAPWFILVSLRDPQFPAFYFIREHFGRYTTVEGYNRWEPWWYFVALLAAGMLPWTTLAIVGLGRSLRRGTAAGVLDVPLLLATWIVVVTVFFSLSRSKLPGYIVPVVPAFAMLAGLACTRAARISLASHLSLALLAALAAFAALMLLPAAADPRYAGYVPWLRAAGLAAIAGAGLALALSWRAAGMPALLALAFASHAATQLALLGHDSLRDRFSSYDLAVEVNRHLDRSQPFYSIGTLDHTLPFYTKKTMTLVAFEDELAFGLSLEPHLGVRTLEEFKARWRAERAPAALMERTTHQSLAAEGMPMRVVAQDERWVVVIKDAAAIAH